MDSSDSEDDWYNRMEAESSKIDDNVLIEMDKNCAEKTYESEDSYLSAVHYHNCEELPNSIADDDNQVWQSVLKQFAKSSNIKEFGYLVQLKLKDISAIELIKQWTFGYLPNSCRVLTEIAWFLDSIEDDNDQMLFTDDVMHPSLVCLIFVKHKAKRVEVSFFSPYKLDHIVLQALLATIERIQRVSGFKDLIYTGINAEIYDTILLSSSIKDNKWQPLWIEYCKQFTYEGKLNSSLLNNVQIPDGYEICDLTLEDANIINDTWKYKSEASIYLVRTMINMQKCQGIRYCHTKKDIIHESTAAESDADKSNTHSSSSVLVCWFLTYPDGSLGMLYTMPEHRGKGLARVIAWATLAKWAAEGVKRPPICAPCVNIEQSNAISMALFTSLGFVKNADIAWAGLTYNDIP